MLQEQFQGKEEVYVVRRPVFRLELDVLCLQELAFPTVVIPGKKAAATLRFPPPCLGGECVLSALWEGLGEVENCLQRSGGGLSSPKTNCSPRAVSVSTLPSGILFYESYVEIWPAVTVTTFLLLAGNVKIKPLNYKRLSQATSFPQHVVKDCVQETVLLYSSQLKNGQRLSFAFKDIGVLSCKDDLLCMRFYSDCVTGLERKASRIALLHTVSCSRF